MFKEKNFRVRIFCVKFYLRFFFQIKFPKNVKFKGNSQTFVSKNCFHDLTILLNILKYKSPREK